MPAPKTLTPEEEQDQTTEEETDADELDEIEDPDELRRQLRDERAQRERAAEALKKANAEAKKYRLRAREAKATATTEGPETDNTAAIEAAKDEVRREFTPRLIRLRAEAKLAGAGAVRPDKVAGLLQVEDLDVDDDGTVPGLDEAIEELKGDMPELFTRPKSSSTDHKATGKGPGAKEKSAGERLAARLQVDT